MNNLISSLEEFVFENKNKSYGAYALRKDYDNNMSKGMLFTFSFVSLMFIISSIYSNKKSDNLDKIDETIVVLSDPIFEEKKKVVVIPKAKEVKASSPPLVKSTTAFTSVNVVRDNTKIKENLLPIVDSLSKNIISTNSTKGTVGGLNESVVSTTNGNGNTSDVNNQTGTKPNGNIEPYAEVMPEFPGGLSALRKFLADNIKYPIVARENKIEGRVILRFIVSKTGDINEVKAVSSFGGGLEQEAMRVVKLMPVWKPGRIKNNEVNVSFTLPIQFKLEN